MSLVYARLEVRHCSFLFADSKARFPFKRTILVQMLDFVVFFILNFFTQRTQAPANRNVRSKQPVMVANASACVSCVFRLRNTRNERNARNAALALHVLRALRMFRKRKRKKRKRLRWQP